jgi:hypothetical protein
MPPYRQNTHLHKLKIKTLLAASSRICTQKLRLFHSPLCTDLSRKDLFSQKCFHNLLGGNIFTFSPINVWSRVSQEHMGHKISGAIGTGSFQSPSAPRDWAVPEPSVHKFCQERAGLPGVWTQAYRPTGETSSSQRQQEHLTPE